MKKVAVFGNAGGGKSTLARKLAEMTQIPLFPLDRIQFRAGGGKVPHDEYLKAHAGLLQRDAWIIDGYGCTESSLERFAAADTLVYIDLPLTRHYFWVTKRLVKGLFVTPEGWPERSPILSSTLDGYRVIRLYNRHLAPKFREYVSTARPHKQVHHLRSVAEMESLLLEVHASTKH